MKNIFEKPSRKSLSIFLGMVSVILLISVAGPIFAAILQIEPPTESKTFKELIDRIISFVSLISLVLAPLMIIFAGFYYMTSNGDPEKVKKANNILLYTAIGIAVILLSRAFVSMVMGVL
ncbi:MAG: pilin [Candidatus Paceibacterota bacterium]|jgi:cytochrome bd-type quinol oxidase subunit 2